MACRAGDVGIMTVRCGAATLLGVQTQSKERHPAKSVIQPNKAEGSCCLRLGGDDFGSATVFHTRRLRSTMKPWAEIRV